MWPFTGSKPRPRTPNCSRRCPYRPRLEALEDRRLLSSGAIDPTFGSGGYVKTALTNSGDFAHGVLLQSNGDLIAYGAANTSAGASFGLARYTPNGNLDTTFDQSGVVVTSKVGGTTISGTGGSDDAAYGVSQAALQSDGRIVAVGSKHGSYGVVTASYIVRYNSNGSVDTTFGNKGLVTIPSGFTVFSVLLQPSNGDIVVGGTSGSAFGLLRCTPSGTLDATFGSSGAVTTTLAIGNGGKGYLALALDNGAIVAAGYSGISGELLTTQTSWIVARYSLSGNLEPTFGTGGIVTTTCGPHLYAGTVTVSLLVQPNSQIVAVGSGTGGNNHTAWQLARYNADGSLDSTFGSGGIVISNPTGGDAANGAALEPNGQIVVVGWGGLGNSYTASPQVGVFNSDGSVDTSFGSGGFLRQPLYNNEDLGGGVVIQPDGKIVTAATAYGNNNGAGNFLLARYGPSAAQIGSFTASPNPVSSGSNVTLTAANITRADPSSAITQVAFYLDSNGDGTREPGTDQLLGYATQTSPGVWTFTYTATLAPGSYTLFANAQDSDGVFSDPLASTLTVQ